MPVMLDLEQSCPKTRMVSAKSWPSRRLRPSEKNPRNCSSMKLELLALKWAVTEKFWTYLLGQNLKSSLASTP